MGDGQDMNQLVWLATWKNHKGLSCDDFRYCDNAYDLSADGRQKVYDLEDELKASGSIAFREKYKQFKMFP
jgi:hypothetical protein